MYNEIAINKMNRSTEHTSSYACTFTCKYMYNEIINKETLIHEKQWIVFTLFKKMCGTVHV